jgi:hypothetical protein
MCLDSVPETVGFREAGHQRLRLGRRILGTESVPRRVHLRGQVRPKELRYLADCGIDNLHSAR